MMVFLKQDTDFQKKIDYEIRMRDGTCKLLAACTQREQALEAAKSLLTCNTRIMAYMSELQRMKEAQVRQRRVRRNPEVCSSCQMWEIREQSSVPDNSVCRKCDQLQVLTDRV
eukprot:g25347.t1